MSGPVRGKLLKGNYCLWEEVCNYDHLTHNILTMPQSDLQSVGIPLRQDEPGMLLNGDGRTGVGARR